MSLLRSIWNLIAGKGEPRTIDMAKIPAAKTTVGMLVRNPAGVSWDEFWAFAESREVRAVGKDVFPCRLIMPCGTVVHYAASKDVPLHDVPCPCGDPTHWLVRIEESVPSS